MNFSPIAPNQRVTITNPEKCSLNSNGYFADLLTLRSRGAGLQFCGRCALNGAGASLEIRLVRSREDVFLTGGVVRVCRAFGADIFHPGTRRATIGYRCRPRHSEDPWIFHRKQKLQVLAPIGSVALHAG